MTNMAKELGTEVGMAWVSDRLCDIFAATFGLEFQQEQQNQPSNTGNIADIT